MGDVEHCIIGHLVCISVGPLESTCRRAPDRDRLNRIIPVEGFERQFRQRC